jgi:NADH dehydrogenase [ubiquinone] 1 alpha subcomplex assembly factor 6
MQLSYTATQVRRDDNDRYLTALHAPAERREALLALYAFNIEIAKTRETVSEPMIGQIRLQWWREAIDEAYAGTVRDHAVLRPLGAAIEAHGLSRGYFDALIDAREFDLTDEPPQTMDALIDYVRQSSSTLIHLALEVLGAREGPAHDAAEPIGIAWGLTGLLRAAPFHARAKRQYLPETLMREASADRADLFELQGSPALAIVAREIAEEARRQLSTGQTLRRDVPRAAIPALLPGVLADLYLKGLARRSHDLFADPVEISQPRRQIRLLRSAFLRRY